MGDLSSAFAVKLIGRLFGEMEEDRQSILLRRFHENPRVQKVATKVFEKHMQRDFRKERVSVGNDLSIESANKLQQIFDNYAIIETRYARIHSPHAEARIARVLSRVVMRSMLSGYRNTPLLIAGESQATIQKDFVDKGFNVVASSVPVYSMKDDATRNLDIRSRTRLGPAESVRSSLAPMQSIVGMRASIIVTLDVYDASIEDRAESMLRASATLHYYSIMVPPNYLADVVARRNPKEKRKVGLGKFRYWFESNGTSDAFNTTVYDTGDGSAHYPHLTSTLVSISKPSFVFTRYGNFFVTNVLQLGVYSFFSMRAIKTVIERPRFITSVRGNISMTRMTYFSYKSGDRDLMSSYVMAEWRAPTQVVNRIVRALTVDLKTKDPKMIQEAVRNFQGVMRTGMAVVDGERMRIPSNDLLGIVASLICYSFRIRVITKRAMNDTYTYQMLKRELKDFDLFSSWFKPKSVIRRIFVSFKLAYHSVVTVCKRSVFLNQVIDVISLERLMRFMKISEIRNFTPTLVEESEQSLLSGADVKFYYYFGGEIDGLVAAPDYIAPTLEEEDTVADVEVSRLFSQEIIEIVEKKDDDDELEEIFVKKEENAKKLAKEHDELSVREISQLLDVLKQEVKDATAAVGLTHATVMLTPDVLRRTSEGFQRPRPETVLETWKQSSNNEQNVVVFTVDANRSVTDIVPKGVELNHSYVFPVDSLVFEFSKKTRTHFGESGAKVGDKVDLPPGRYFTQKCVKVFPIPEILNTWYTRGMSSNELRSLTMHLFSAVAGHGKTYKLVQTFFNLDALLLCNGTASKKDLVKKLHNKYGTRFREVRVRTLDSYLIKPDVKTRHLIFEERFMMPQGKVNMAIKYATMDDGQMFVQDIGDPEQIPYIPRGSCPQSLQVLGTERMEFYTTREFGTDSKRISRHQAVLVQDFYDREIFSTSGVESAVGFKPITGVGDIPLMPGVLYQTFTQGEKLEFYKYVTKSGYSVVPLDALGKTKNSVSVELFEDVDKTGAGTGSLVSVNTTHEVQGSDVACSIGFRLNTSNQTLWDSDPHLLVMLTRSQHAFLFCGITLPSDDKLYKLVKKKVTKLEMQKKFYGPDSVVLHTSRECKCGGDKHPLVGMVERLL